MKLDNHSLYYYDTCPFCMRVLFAIKELNLEIELRNIQTNMEHRNELTQGGGNQMVPCLRIDKGGETQWMYESLDIIDYLKNQV